VNSVATRTSACVASSPQTHDTGIKAIFDALKTPIQLPAPPRRRIGFIAEAQR
jgi:hypothetical protein